MREPEHLRDEGWHLAFHQSEGVDFLAIDRQVAVPDLRASIFELIDKPSSAEIAGVSAGLPPGQIQITTDPVVFQSEPTDGFRSPDHRLLSLEM